METRVEITADRYSDLLLKENLLEQAVSKTEFVTIPLERYNELLRKEIGFEIRREELKDFTFGGAERKVIYDLEDKNETVRD